MKRNNESKKRTAGRRPKADPAVFRYSISLNAADHNKFLSLFEQSGAKVKAGFITSCIFNKPVRVVKTDKGLHDFYMRLTTFFEQFRAIGTNYNQVVKALNSNFSEKKALTFLYKLEKVTIELVSLQQKIIALATELKQKIDRDGSQD